MPTHTVAAAERHDLCDTFLEVGPEAPTLCSPWRTRDLAAHLVLREHRPVWVLAVLGAGLVLLGLLDRKSVV